MVASVDAEPSIIVRIEEVSATVVQGAEIGERLRIRAKPRRASAIRHPKDLGLRALPRGPLDRLPAGAGWGVGCGVPAEAERVDGHLIVASAREDPIHGEVLARPVA